MTIGTLQGAVSDCVVSVLNGLGLHQIDLQKSLANYGYKYQNMYAVHSGVQTCLKIKGYNYTFPITDAYFKKTVAMSLLQLCSFISTQTQAGAIGAAWARAGAIAGKGRGVKVKKAVKKPAKKAARKATKKSKTKAAKRYA